MAHIPDLPISSMVISLPKVAVQQISALVKLLYRLSQLKIYRGLIQTEEKDFQQVHLDSSSLLMSYDFHWNQDQLQLIEVNTNASGYLLSDLVDQVHDKETSALLSLKNSFQQEWNKWQRRVAADTCKHDVQSRDNNVNEAAAKSHPLGGQDSDIGAGNRGGADARAGTCKRDLQDSDIGAEESRRRRVAGDICKHDLQGCDNRAGNRGEMSPATRGLAHFLIVDQEVKAQKMYIEFLMYKDWLAGCGWPCQICEISDLALNTEGQIIDSHLAKVDMIYNRCTDFYLKNYPNIKKAFLNQTCLILPNPLDYLFLADKSRLCEWSSEVFLDRLPCSQKDKYLIQQSIPFTGLVHSVDADYLWQHRKKFIFKPLRGHGGKAVYRGKSITRSKFKEIISEAAYVYQKYVPPGYWIDSERQKWKYDIRAYVYQDQVQHLTARIYQGQVTGFRTEGSGFASISTQ